MVKDHFHLDIEEVSCLIKVERLDQIRYLGIEKSSRRVRVKERC